MKFDRDDGNTAKCAKHGLTTAEIEWTPEYAARVAADPGHSAKEERLIALGRTANGRPVFIAYCWRGDRVRPISAHYMNGREAQRHGI